MIANVLTAAFLSIASFLIFLKQNTRTGKFSFLMFTVGFGHMAVGYATWSNEAAYIPGFGLLFAGFVTILLDACGCLEWTRRREE